MSSLIVAKIESIRRVDYQGERVVTLSMMDELHERPSGTAKRNFGQHRDKLLEGEDFFEIPADEFRTLGLREHGGGTEGILLTQSGYLMLVKSFRDEMAWDVQRGLVKHYFRSTEQLPSNHLIGYEIARGIREGLTHFESKFYGEIDTVKSKVDSVETTVLNGFAEINGRIDAIEKRKDLTSATKRQHIEVVAHYFSGNCPCCHDLKILDAGLNRINAHFDHWFSKGRNRAHETWLVCDSCNQNLLNYQFRDKHKAAFEHYQMRREQKFCPLLVDIFVGEG